MFSRLQESERQKTASLAGLCLFLSSLEYIIPRPLPFLRLGLANLPLLLSVSRLSPLAFAALVLLKTCAASVLSGALFSYVFLLSFAGSLASGLAMYSLRPLLLARRISFIGLSLCGSLASNTAQLLLAALFLPEAAVRLIAPPLLACGLVTGFLLGALGERIGSVERKWEAGKWGVGSIGNGGMHSEVSAESGVSETAECIPKFPRSRERGAGSGGREQGIGNGEWGMGEWEVGSGEWGFGSKDYRTAERLLGSSTDFRVRPHFPFPISNQTTESSPGSQQDFCAETLPTSPPHFPLPLLLLLPAILLFLLPVWPRTALFACIFAISIVLRKEKRPLMTVFVFACFTLGNLLVPYGKTLLTIGPFPLTLGALETGFRKASAVQGLFLLSRLCPPLPLPKRFPLLSQTLAEFASLNRRFSTVRTPADIMRVVRESV